ncbi:MAG: ribosome assembly cofactor RimP [Bacteroidetes bacterium]|nr:ribosome assembly cofactor RimP [Bacteroidota bacterium]
MITVDTIKKLVEEKLEEDLFWVDISVKSGNKIFVALERESGLKINDCITVSRHIEANLNRDVEDYELEVSSPGLEQPYKVLRQYQKRLGKNIQAITKDGKGYQGKLAEVTDAYITIEEEKKVKIEGKKGKQTVVDKIVLPFEQIKEAKALIVFGKIK